MDVKLRGLAKTIARLQAFRAGSRSPANDPVNDRLSDLFNFGSNPGALQSRFYVPAQLPDGAPLVVVLHGCTQTAAGFDYNSGWSQLADQMGFALLFPEQQRCNNANLCFNWFVPEDIRRNGGEALSIRQMIETFVVAHAIDRRRIFVTGLSAGGAMTAVMLAAYPDIFAGGAIIAGLPYGSATTIPEAFESMRSPSKLRLDGLVQGASTHQGPWPTVSVWQGSADHTVDSSNAEAIIGQWREIHGLRETSTRTEIIDGHTRRIWCNAEGRALIEEYIIAGMGHGAPLKTSGEDGLGFAGPFMLEAGISSTSHIARFWGILKPGQSRPRSTAGAEVLSKPRLVRDQQRIPPPPANTGGIRTVIEDALRKAGLMR